MTIPVAHDVARSALTRDQVAAILAFHDEPCAPEQVRFYQSLEDLAERVRSSRSWAEGEVFVWAQAADHFVVMKQIAPSSCELMTITASGFKDVLTGYRFDTAELVKQLRGYLDEVGKLETS